MTHPRIQAIAATWRSLSSRERGLLLGLSALLVATALFSLIWQPQQQRLASAQERYQQQRMLAAQLQQTLPPRQAQPRGEQPLSLRISESILAAGLQLQHIDSDHDGLSLTLNGDVMLLLSWLDRMEREGAELQALVLEKRGGGLEAQVRLK